MEHGNDCLWASWSNGGCDRSRQVQIESCAQPFCCAPHLLCSRSAQALGVQQSAQCAVSWPRALARPFWARRRPSGACLALPPAGAFPTPEACPASLAAAVAGPLYAQVKAWHLHQHWFETPPGHLNVHGFGKGWAGAHWVQGAVGMAVAMVSGAVCCKIAKIEKCIPVRR